jgi:hypothetical protein
MAARGSNDGTVMTLVEPQPAYEPPREEPAWDDLTRPA